MPHRKSLKQYCLIPLWNKLIFKSCQIKLFFADSMGQIESKSKYQVRPKLQLAPKHDGWQKHPELLRLHWVQKTQHCSRTCIITVTASEHMMFPNLTWLSSCTAYTPTKILQLNLVTKEIQELQETLTLYCVTEDFFFSCLQKESRSSKKHKGVQKISSNFYRQFNQQTSLHEYISDLRPPWYWGPVPQPQAAMSVS